MNPLSFTVLHGGYGPEVTLAEYLFRVVLHLLGLTGVTVLALRAMSAVDTVRSAVVALRDAEASER